MKINEALKGWLQNNKHEFVEVWNSSGWCDSETGTIWNGTEYESLDMDKLLEQIDKFCDTFNKETL